MRHYARQLHLLIGVAALALLISTDGMARQDAGDDDDDDRARTAYLLLPMNGPIGRDLARGVEQVDESTVTSEGVEAALKLAARKRGVEHVVLEIDSAGGSLHEAERILDVLAAHDDRFIYHALIHQSHDAALPIALAADHLYVVPRAGQPAHAAPAIAWQLGDSAIASAGEHDSVAAWTDALRALAEKKAHSVAIVEALILTERALFAGRSASGEMIVSGTAEKAGGAGGAGGDEVRQIDSPHSRLTLTADQAVELGLADRADNGAASIGTLLELPSWEQYGEYGHAQMTRALELMQRAERERLEQLEEASAALERAEAIINELDSTATAARRADPNRYTYETRRDVRRDGRYLVEYDALTTAARRLWVQRTDESAAKWQEVQNLIRAAQRQVALVKKTGRSLERSDPRWDVADAHAEQLEALGEKLKSVLATESQIAGLANESERSLRKLARERDRQ